MNKDYIFFDLDGTLTDPKEGITRSVQYSLLAFGIQADTADLVAFIGPPLRDSYKKYYSFTDIDAEIAVAKYREYYNERGIYENSVYDGISGMLKELLERGKKLIVATSKPTVYAERILKYFDIDKYFLFVAGSELDGRRSDKELVLRYAIENIGDCDLEKSVMIGDREHDVIGAKKIGMDSIGVLYGYGGYEELLKAGATYIADSVKGLWELLG